jgi:hypothetical protein
MRSSAIFQASTETIDEYRSPTFHDICSSEKWFDPSAHPSQVDTIVVAPVFENFDANASIVGHYFAVVPWKVFFEDELVTGTDPVVAVVSSSCGHTFTFEIKGHEANFLGEGDVHSSSYDEMGMTSIFADFAHSSSCEYTITVFPTSTYEDSYITQKPMIYMVAVFVIFFFTSMSFLVFDCLVQRRQQKLVTTARKQGAIVSSLFPKVRFSRLLNCPSILISIGTAHDHGTHL